MFWKENNSLRIIWKTLRKRGSTKTAWTNLSI